MSVATRCLEHDPWDLLLAVSTWEHVLLLPSEYRWPVCVGFFDCEIERNTNGLDGNPQVCVRLSPQRLRKDPQVGLIPRLLHALSDWFRHYRTGLTPSRISATHHTWSAARMDMRILILSHSSHVVRRCVRCPISLNRSDSSRSITGLDISK